MNEPKSNVLPFPQHRPENELAGQLQRLSAASIDQIVELHEIAEAGEIELPSLLRFTGQLFRNLDQEDFFLIKTHPLGPQHQYPQPLL